MRANKDMLVVDVLNMDRGSAAVFFRHGLHCLGCAMSHGETLEQACDAHGLDVDDLLADSMRILTR